MPGERLPQPAEWTARSHHDEHIESEHRRGQHERQRDDRLDHKGPPTASKRQPPGERHADEQKDADDDGREPEAQYDGLPVDAWGHRATPNPDVRSSATISGFAR